MRPSGATRELNVKLERLRELASRHGLEAILLQRVSSFAWATCGASAYVNIASSQAAAALLITQDARYLLCNNIEAARLEKEEKLHEQGWEFCIAPWYEGDDRLKKMIRGKKIGADQCLPGAMDLSAEIAHLRARLTEEEGERFREVGRLSAQAMEASARALRPGQSEHEIAALLAMEAERNGMQATVNLVATDERVFQFRHPLPTEKKLERYAMLVLCARKYGLVCSITRLIHFGPLSPEIRQKAEAVARVDAAMIAATRPGRTLGEIFQIGAAAYQRYGYADEWKWHHQGGPAGYEPREILATPNCTDEVSTGQAIAWNPSITGTKSEDTILVGAEDNEILTAIPGWPVLLVESDGKTIARPAILEIE